MHHIICIYAYWKGFIPPPSSPAPAHVTPSTVEFLSVHTYVYVSHSDIQECTLVAQLFVLNIMVCYEGLMSVWFSLPLIQTQTKVRRKTRNNSYQGKFNVEKEPKEEVDYF